jgi:hypothetical protein
MNKTTQFAVGIIALTFFLQGRQIGSVDLSHPPETSKATSDQEKTALPKGCEKLSGGGIADGWVKPEDHLPRDILVEVIKVSDTESAVGSELEAEVQLQNADKQPIQIPWSTDSSLIENGQDPEHLQWEVGTFEFALRDSEDHQIALKSLTGWMYGSKFTSGSELTIRPGESITALVKFKLEDKYPIEPGRPKEGKWQLLATWHQVGRSWSVKNCEVWNGYSMYDDFYRQHSVPLTIQVTAPDSKLQNELAK